MLQGEMGTYFKALWILTILLALPAAALGQAGYIGLYADPAGTLCNVTDGGGGEVNVYVVHKATAGAAASQWKIISDNGFAMAYLGETWSTAAIGDTQSGVTTSYGACQASPILLCTVTYMSYGVSASCSSLQVVPDPSSVSGAIEVVDCSSNRITASGGTLIVNPDGSCPCGQASNVQETDWGRIKAMFSD
jgi:hypothetical protein